MLQTKNRNSKQLISEMSVHKKQLAELIRTETILNRQYEEISQELLKVEKTNKVVSYRDIRKEIETDAVEKNELDESKSVSLEELTRLTYEISQQIQARNSELKPLDAKIQEKEKKKVLLKQSSFKLKIDITPLFKNIILLFLNWKKNASNTVRKYHIFK
jgi:hypothetical protein